MWSLIKRESLENVLTLRFVIGFFACNLLFALSTYVLVQDYSTDLHSVRSAIRDTENKIQEWTVYSYIRPTIICSPSPLSVFGPRAESFGGSRIWISHTRIPVFAETTEDRSDFLSFYSGFDFATTVRLFIALLAILFTFDAISGEKERGSLRLVLSCGIGRAQLVGAKFFGAVAALTTLAFSGFVVSLLIFIAFSPAGFGAQGWLRLSIVLLVMILYGAVFVALGLLISVLTHRAAISLVAGMIVWVVLVLLLPNAISFFSGGFGFREDARDLQNNLERLTEEFEKRQSEMRLHGIADYQVVGGHQYEGEGQIKYMVIGDNAVDYLLDMLPKWLRKQDDYAARRYDLENTYYRQRLKKMGIAKILLCCSPAAVMTQAFSALTSSDVSSHLHFVDEARSYRRQVIEYIRSKGGYQSPRWFTDEQRVTSYRDVINTLETMTTQEQMVYITESGVMQQIVTVLDEIENDPRRKLDLHDLPRFQMSSVPLSTSLPAALPDLLLLVFYLAVAFGLTLIRFSFYDVR